MSYFRSFWQPYLGFTAIGGIILILLLGIPRFIVVLNANKTGNYNFTSLIFVIMWILPFLLLNVNGRQLIGLKKPAKFWRLVLCLLTGISLCIPVFLLGSWLYGESIDNWVVYISNSYRDVLPTDLESTKLQYFLIFAGISMIFSPIGEELMYRGMIHQCFVNRYGHRGASRIDSAAFALTHLAHFGIIYGVTGWTFHPIPSLLWVICMYIVSRVFFFCKGYAGSIYGAIASHAGFNLAMTYFIFYFIL